MNYPRIVKNWFEKPTHTARILSPKGIYPRESISFSEGLYIADDELSFSVVSHCEPYPESEMYSELQWLTVSEIRTYGALMLAVDRERGYAAVYPYPPMSADDYYDLFSELQEVYQYLLTGYVQPWRLRRAGLLE